MITYFKMKKNEWKVKSLFYGTIAKFIDEQDEVIDMAKKMYESLKGMTGDEIRDVLIEKIAEAVHTQAMKEREDGSVNDD